MQGIFNRRKHFDIMGLRVIMKGKENFLSPAAVRNTGREHYYMDKQRKQAVSDIVELLIKEQDNERINEYENQLLGMLEEHVTEMRLQMYWRAGSCRPCFQIP